MWLQREDFGPFNAPLGLCQNNFRTTKKTLVLGSFVSLYTFQLISIIMLIAFRDFEKSGRRMGRNSVHASTPSGFILLKANEIVKSYAD